MRRLYHASLWRALGVVVALITALLMPRVVLAQHAAEAPSATAPHAAQHAAPSASVRAGPTAEVRVREKVIFVFRADRGGRSAQERAKAANTAIEALLGHPDQVGDVHFEETQGTAVVYVGKTPVLTLGEEDVEATGEASVGVLGGQVSARLADALATERKRSAIATSVFSFSLLIFSALIAFLFLGRASDVASRVRTWMTKNPERVTAVRLGKIEVLSAGAARGTLSIALTLG